MKTKKPIPDDTKFNDAVNGYGFEEVDQEADGIYCTGCCVVHKRPTKMYSNSKTKGPHREVLCRHAVIRFWWDSSISE